MIYLILILIILISIGCNILFANTLKKKNQIIAQKDIAIENASQNMKHLVDYQDVITNIQKDHQEVYNQIKEAKTDEEVNNIIRHIVDVNNKHVHDG